MKNIIFRAVPLLSGALLCAVAQAQDAPARPTNSLNAMVAPMPAAAPAETLLALAKAADANVLADVDDADVDDAATPAVAPVSADREQTLFMALNSLTSAQDWSWRRDAEGTLLLWKSPDFVVLARQISDANAASAKAASAKAAGATDAAKAPAVAAPQSEPLGVALTRYFATPAAHNDPKNPASWRAVPLAELPPALRDRIIDDARAGQQQDLQFAASSAVLSDEFWKTAVLKLREFKAPAPRANQTDNTRTPAEILAEAKAAPVTLQKYLFVVGDFKRDSGSATTMLSLGRWTPDAATP